MKPMRLVTDSCREKDETKGDRLPVVCAAARMLACFSLQQLQELGCEQTQAEGAQKRRRCEAALPEIQTFVMRVSFAEHLFKTFDIMLVLPAN